MEDLDNQLKAVFGSYSREKMTDSEYTLSYSYDAQVTDGKINIYASYDKKEAKMKDISTTLRLNYDYTYKAD